MDVLPLHQAADEVPEDTRGQLSSAIDAGALATEVIVSQLVLTYLMPGTDEQPAIRVASPRYSVHSGIAVEGPTIELGASR